MVSGVLRSWLTWPANDASRSFDRSSSACTAWFSMRLRASSRLRSRSSKTSTTRSASVARAATWLGSRSRGSLVEDAQGADGDALAGHQRVRDVEPDLAQLPGHERVAREPRVRSRRRRARPAPPRGPSPRTSSPRVGTSAASKPTVAIWCCSVSVMMLIVAIGTSAIWAASSTTDCSSAARWHPHRVVRRDRGDAALVVDLGDSHRAQDRDRRSDFAAERHGSRGPGRSAGPGAPHSASQPDSSGSIGSSARERVADLQLEQVVARCGPVGANG